jgi:hypothetical protein
MTSHAGLYSGAAVFFGDFAAVSIFHHFDLLFANPLKLSTRGSQPRGSPLYTIPLYLYTLYTIPISPGDHRTLYTLYTMPRGSPRPRTPPPRFADSLARGRHSSELLEGGTHRNCSRKASRSCRAPRASPVPPTAISRPSASTAASASTSAARAVAQTKGWK